MRMVSVLSAWGLDGSSCFLGWDRLLCLLQLTSGEFLIGGVTEIIPRPMVSFVCVTPAAVDRSLTGTAAGAALGKDFGFLANGEHCDLVCDKAKQAAWSPGRGLGPKENRNH